MLAGGSKQLVFSAVKYGGKGEGVGKESEIAKITAVYLYFNLYKSKTNIKAKYLTNRTICC